jgi:hypothetical protein
MCKSKKPCTKCQNKANRMGAVGRTKKKGGKKRITRRRRSRVSGVGDVFNIEELALIGAGALASKMLVNPLSNAIFTKSNPPKYFPIVAKAALSLGLSQLKMKETDSMAKGAALAAVIELAETYLPSVFKKNPIKADPNMAGYGDELGDNVELNLDDVSGYGDTLAGYGDDSLAGYGDDSLAGSAF